MSLPSSASVVHKHDGHIEGYLNCVASRHGWSRTFSISPQEIEAFDYARLARILELSTLKLRSSNLRIFVENPRGSRLYSKVRFWKDDSSLQSVLVKKFFEERMKDGGICRFEIRDGKERAGGVWEEDDMTGGADSVAAAGSDAGSRILPKGKKRSWFGLRSAAKAHAEQPPDDQQDIGKVSPTRASTPQSFEE